MSDEHRAALHLHTPPRSKTISFTKAGVEAAFGRQRSYCSDMNRCLRVTENEAFVCLENVVFVCLQFSERRNRRFTRAVITHQCM